MAVVLVDDQVWLKGNPCFHTGIQKAAYFGQGAGFFGIDAKVSDADHTVTHTQSEQGFGNGGRHGNDAQSDDDRGQYD